MSLLLHCLVTAHKSPLKRLFGFGSGTVSNPANFLRSPFTDNNMEMIFGIYLHAVSLWSNITRCITLIFDRSQCHMTDKNCLLVVSLACDHFISEAMLKDVCKI